MRFFTWLDFQYWAMALFLGLSSFILVWMAWGTYPLHRERKTEEDLEELEGHEIKKGHDVEKVPIAPFLIFVYMLIVVWSIGYMVYFVVRGATI